MRLLPGIATLVCLLTLPYSAEAQFRGPFGPRGEDSDRGDGDRRRGDDDDDRDRGGFDWRRRSEEGGEGDRGRSGWSGWSRDGGGGDSDRRGGGPPGGFGGGFGPPGGFGGGFGPPGGFGGGFGGPPGGFGGYGGGRPSPEFFFERLDKDGDGKLNGEEIEGAGFFRGMLERAGIQEGASRDDFTRGFEQYRSERERGEDGGGRERDSRSATKYYVPAKKERVTVDLPDDYLDRDVDGDGQIGLYEWREWDRGSVDEFFAYDRNGDGFLTPKEVAAGPGERPADDGDSRNAVAGRGPVPQPTDEGGGDDAEAEKGRRFFGLVDADHDGTATPEELSKLNKLRPMFEKAGVRLDQEMTQAQFVSNYLRAVR